MNRLDYARPTSIEDALQFGARDGSRYIAGGTIDLMKENGERSARVIDISRLPLDRIEEADEDGLRLSALVANADTAEDTMIELDDDDVG